MIFTQKKWFKSAFSEESLATTYDPSPPKRRKRNSNISLESSFTSASDDTIKQNEIVAEVKIECPDFGSSNWIENFAPQDRSELAVHNKKIKELEEWFNSIKSNGKKCSSPMLLITGPSGSGKTSALKVLAKEFQYAISEWITPIDMDNGKENENGKIVYNETQTEKFMEFLMHSSRYRSLFEVNRQRLVLVEDFPNVFLKDPESFTNILEHYKTYGKSPLVFIVTDTKSRTLNISHSIFTSELRQNFDITSISFNPVADTLVQKGLKRIGAIMKQSGFQKYYNQPSVDVVDSIVLSSQGDLRNAVINLHFASQKSKC